MREDRLKKRGSGDCAIALQPGQVTARTGIAMFAFVIMAIVCLLGSTATVRLVGSLLLAVAFAMCDWQAWKIGFLKTNMGVISRTERPVAFHLVSIFFLLGECFLVFIAVSRALQAPTW